MTEQERSPLDYANMLHWAPEDVRAAHDLLASQKLVAGNDKQIAAVNTIKKWVDDMEAREAEISDLKDAGRIECIECGGDGWHECSCGHDHECGTCDGEGWVEEADEADE